MPQKGIGGAVQFFCHAAPVDHKAHQDEQWHNRQAIGLATVDHQARGIGHARTVVGQFGEPDKADQTQRNTQRHAQEGKDQNNSKADKCDGHMPSS